MYPKLEVSKLARYIGTTKPQSIPWRLTHPYLLADRWQVVEDNSYKKEDMVDVCFYGYIRGSSYRGNGKVHIVGMGDFLVKRVDVLTDPCPEFKRQDGHAEETNPDNDIEGESIKQVGENVAGQDVEGVAMGAKKSKRRTLNQSERIIYAPQCNLGSLNYDSSGYVTIPYEYVKFTRMKG